jgi:hypothetical protein
MMVALLVSKLPHLTLSVMVGSASSSTAACQEDVQHRTMIVVLVGSQSRQKPYASTRVVINLPAAPK